MKKNKRKDMMPLIETAMAKVELVHFILEQPGEMLTDGARAGALAVLEEVNQVFTAVKESS